MWNVNAAMIASRNFLQSTLELIASSLFVRCNLGSGLREWRKRVTNSSFFLLKIARLRALRHGIKCHSLLGDTLAQARWTCISPTQPQAGCIKFQRKIYLNKSIRWRSWEFADLNKVNTNFDLNTARSWVAIKFKLWGSFWNSLVNVARGIFQSHHVT